MADHPKEEAIVEEVAEDTNNSDLPSHEEEEEEVLSIKAKVYRVFRREIPVHRALGGAKLADVFLWKEKKVSAAVLGVATVVWVMFDVLEYSLVALVSHVLIFGLAVLFLWSNAKTLVHKSPTSIPEVVIPEDIVLNCAAALRTEINHGFAVLSGIGAGRDAKKFFSVISTLWGLSTVGTWCNFSTLLYMITVLLFTVPFFYEKYGDKLESFAKEVMTELRRQYAVFDGRVWSKGSHSPLKRKN